MDKRTEDNELSIILRSYGNEEVRGKNFVEHTISFTAISNQEQEELDKYGLYTVILNDDRLTNRAFTLSLHILKGKNSEDNKDNKDNKDNEEVIEIINSNVDKNKEIKSEEEYFIQYKEGFLFFETKANDIMYFTLSVGGKEYKSETLIVQQNNNEKKDQKEIIEMVEEVYSEQPLLLLSVFQNSPLSVYIGKDSNIKNTITTRVKLIEKSIEIYYKQYSDIKRALKFKLKNYEYVDGIHKLSSLSASTISFISRNPQYLLEVKKKKGIKYNGKVYLPEKTLVSRNVINYDIYENRYIISFLKLLINECSRLSINIKLAEKMASLYLKRASLKTNKREFKTLLEKYQKLYSAVEKHKKNANKLFVIYKKVFEMDKKKDISSNISKPKATAIFNQLPEYNIFFRQVFIPWFEHGMNVSEFGTSAMKDSLVTAISRPSTTYELFIVSKWIKYFSEVYEDGTYEFDSSKAKFAGIHIDEKKYSDYAYEFVFYKEMEDGIREEITLFYSPSIYTLKGKNKVLPLENVDSNLYRNTFYSVSFKKEDGETDNISQGAHYEPDFIIRYQRGKYSKDNKKFIDKTIIRYIMCDAKHMDYEKVLKEQIWSLQGKYLTSINVLSSETYDAAIAGLCAVYNEGGEESVTEICGDNVEGQENRPFIKLIRLNVKERDWKESFGEIIDSAKSFNVENDISNIMKSVAQLSKEQLKTIYSQIGNILNDE